MISSSHKSYVTKLTLENKLNKTTSKATTRATQDKLVKEVQERIMILIPTVE
jgi:hypothetical protein